MLVLNSENENPSVTALPCHLPLGKGGFICATISIKSGVWDVVGAIHESPANAAQADRPGGRSLRRWLQAAKKSPSITSIKSDNFVVRRGAGASTVLVYGLTPATKYYTKLAFLELQSAKKLQ